MASVSVLIFIYEPTTRVASVAVVNINDAGFTASAAAMSMCIVAACAVFKGLQGLLERAATGRTDAWKDR
jgi:iron(III) transport system permease protein